MYSVQMLPMAAGAQALYEDAVFLEGPHSAQDVVDRLYPWPEVHEEHCNEGR